MVIRNEDDYLMLSGIQHFEFCPRQWALIHIEQQWEENVRTVEGQYLHRNADQPFFREKRGEKVTVRSLRVQSHELAITGVCDVVEFIEDMAGVYIPKLDSTYRVQPVEYKRGKPKKSDVDILQLVAQAMCLEEMLVCDIPVGFLFYNEIKRRIEVPITIELRAKVRAIVSEMQRLYQRNHTPKVKTGPWCRSCSLNNICLPELMKTESASSFIERRLAE